MKHYLLAILLLCAAGCQTPLSAPPAERPPVPMVAVPRVATPLAIDGRLDEPVWAHAAVIPALLPCRNKTDEHLTPLPATVRLLWDPNYLYVGLTCAATNLYLTGRLSHDGPLHEEDVFEIFIDGKGDGQQNFEIQINADNVTCDIMNVVTVPVQCTPDQILTPEICLWDLWGFREWNMSGMKTATQKTLRDGRVVGWTAELALPAFWIARRSGLRQFEPMDLRANFVRMDWQREAPTGPRKMFQANWSPVMYGCPHISPWAMGTLRLEDRPAKEN